MRQRQPIINFDKATSFRFVYFFDSDVVMRIALLQFLAPNAKIHPSGRQSFFHILFFFMGNVKNSDICILAIKRQRHLSLTKQATGGLRNERQSDIENPLRRCSQASCSNTVHDLSTSREDRATPHILSCISPLIGHKN